MIQVLRTLPICTVVFAVLAASSAGDAAAQDRRGTSMTEDFVCGHALLGRALQAAGGEQAVAGIRQVGFTAAGDSNNAYQVCRVESIDAPERDGAFRVDGAFDL